jgi:hypothetical protein
MTLATKKRRSWLCPKCSHRNEATRSRKCGNCLEMSRPKKRVPKHAETLRDDSYDVYALLSQTIHGGDNEACGVCQRPKPETRRHDRDHDHRTGRPRGLACVRCNRELLRHSTLEEARAVVAYLEREQAYYARGERDG